MNSGAGIWAGSKSQRQVYIKRGLGRVEFWAKGWAGVCLVLDLGNNKGPVWFWY